MPKGMLRTRRRNRIAMLREHQGWTQASLAARLGVSESTVAKWEMDVHLPSAGLVASMARLLQCRPADLYPYDYV